MLTHSGGKARASGQPSVTRAPCDRSLQLLVEVDEDYSSDEQMAYDELSGQICQYRSDDPVGGMFKVIIYA